MSTRRSIPRSGPRPKNHAGDEFDPAECDFFAPPPPEIGTVLTQWSTLTPQAPFMDPARRLAMIALAMAVLGGPGVVLGVATGAPAIAVVVGGFGALVGGGFVWIATRRLRLCSYVGELGAAQFWCSGSRDRIVVREVFLYETASELRAKTIRNYAEMHSYGMTVARMYRNTSYDYRWLNAAGAVFSISGTFVSEFDIPPAGDPFYFARRTEMVWTSYLVQHLDLLTNDAGNLEFSLGDADFLELGEEHLAVHFTSRGETLVFPRHDITRFSVDAGVVTVSRSSGEWASFPLGDLGNSQFFLQAASVRLGR